MAGRKGAGCEPSEQFQNVCVCSLEKLIGFQTLQVFWALRV